MLRLFARKQSHAPTEIVWRVSYVIFNLQVALLDYLFYILEWSLPGRFLCLIVSIWLLLWFSCYVVSDSLQPCGLQQDRHPCPSPSPGAYSDSCLLSPWWHPAISSSVVPFSACSESFPATGFFSGWVSSLHQGAKVTLFSEAAYIMPPEMEGKCYFLH